MMTGGSYSIGKDRLAAEEPVHLRGHSTALLVRGFRHRTTLFQSPNRTAKRGPKGEIGKADSRFTCETRQEIGRGPSSTWTLKRCREGFGDGLDNVLRAVALGLLIELRSWCLCRLLTSTSSFFMQEACRVGFISMQLNATRLNTANVNFHNCRGYFSARNP